MTSRLPLPCCSWETLTDSSTQKSKRKIKKPRWKSAWHKLASVFDRRAISVLWSRPIIVSFLRGIAARVYRLRISRIPRETRKASREKPFTFARKYVTWSVVYTRARARVVCVVGGEGVWKIVIIKVFLYRILYKFIYRYLYIHKESINFEVESFRLSAFNCDSRGVMLADSTLAVKNRNLSTHAVRSFSWYTRL